MNAKQRRKARRKLVRRTDWLPFNVNRSDFALRSYFYTAVRMSDRLAAVPVDLLEPV